ncbi:hypothetical protein [Spiroplasma endosymbiont of Lasioglossum malachurum]|uniref:hypothetical protein n=1 Tax=Spiroplasma endosymbiont of Lasioglossum malachurum TaxID=3066319 RepID=UPI0030CCAC71
MFKSKTQERQQLKYHLQNQQNRLKETVLEEQTICGVTESFVKLTEQQLKKHNYANRNEITNLEIDQRLRNRFAIETKTKGTTNAGICSSDVLYDKEIKASKSKIAQNIRTVYYAPPSTYSMWSPKKQVRQWNEEMKNKSNQDAGRRLFSNLCFFVLQSTSSD